MRRRNAKVRISRFSRGSSASLIDDVPPSSELPSIESLAGMPFHEREIIRLHLGIGDGQKFSAREIGRIFKMEAEIVRNIIAGFVARAGASAEGPTANRDSIRPPGRQYRIGKPQVHPDAIFEVRK